MCGRLQADKQLWKAKSEQAEARVNELKAKLAGLQAAGDAA